MINDQRQPRNIPPGDIPRPGVIAPRTLRTSSGSRDIPRRSRPPDDLLAISWHLEPRDYVIAHLLAEHRFLTTDQIAAILFTSPRTCRNRLNVLRQLAFIDWFMPVHPAHGRRPVHWVPGRLSARYVALYHGRPAPSSRAVRDERDTHPSTATRLGHLMHADGTNQFFLDHDTGTESHPARAAKLVGYRTLRDKGMAWPVLFWLPTTTIETHLHRHLADHADGTRGIVVATAARDHAAQHGGPAGPVWRMVGNGRRRLRLAELPGPVGPTGLAYHPGPPQPQEDPLYLLRDDTDPAPA